MMDRIRRWITPPAPSIVYEPVEGSDEVDQTVSQDRLLSPFSRLEYAVFFLLGVSMLWPWWVLSHCSCYYLYWDDDG